MPTQVNEFEIPPLKFDGRLMCMSVDHNDDVWAMFNTRKTEAIKLTNQQFERYKPFCELPVVDEKIPRIKQYYGVISDNGLPKWFNWF